MTTIDLAALNSATKYPSIETYHKLDERGTLTEELNFEFDGQVIMTEKVDGTSGRIIRMPGNDYIIGSRNELLYAKGDRIGNPCEGIAEHLRPVAERLGALDDDRYIHVYYTEVYGGRIGAQHRQYTGQGAVGHRLFDVALVPVEVLEWPVEKISSWRQQGGQKFFTEGTLQLVAAAGKIPLVPRVGTAYGLPTSREEMEQWLRAALPHTNVALDDDGGAKAEGLVLRTVDRRTIAKARFADYAKALNPQPTKKRRP